MTLFRQAPHHPRGKLKIDVPGRLGRLVIAPALPDFFARYPAIELELGVSDRAVDLVRDGVDCVVRVGPLADSTLIARKLGDLALCNCASPAYLQARGTPRALPDLQHHLAVGYASPSSGRVEDWEQVANGEVCTLSMRAHLVVGELVEVLPEFRAAPMPITMVYPHRQHLSRRLQVFVEWATSLLQSIV